MGTSPSWFRNQVSNLWAPFKATTFLGKSLEGVSRAVIALSILAIPVAVVLFAPKIYARFIPSKPALPNPAKKEADDLEAQPSSQDQRAQAASSSSTVDQPALIKKSLKTENVSSQIGTPMKGYSLQLTKLSGFQCSDIMWNFFWDKMIIKLQVSRAPKFLGMNYAYVFMFYSVNEFSKVEKSGDELIQWVNNQLLEDAHKTALKYAFTKQFNWEELNKDGILNAALSIKKPQKADVDTAIQTMFSTASERWDRLTASASD